MSTVFDSLWVEKYRPRDFEKVVLSDYHKDFLKSCLDRRSIPHLLLVGPPGSGKTTVAKIIYDTICKDKEDRMILNGSDDTGVDIMRNTIVPFLRTPPSVSNHKIVFIDEADYLTHNSQAAARRILEEGSVAGRFLCTANYKSKFSPALLSRFQVLEFKTFSKEFVVELCTGILTAEQVQYDVSDIELIVNTLIPDVRKIINTLQQHCIGKTLKPVNKQGIMSRERAIVSLVCTLCDNLATENRDRFVAAKVPEIIQMVNEDVEPDYLNIYEELFNANIPIWAKIVVSQYCQQHTQCAIPTIHFVAMVWKIVQQARSLYGSMK